MTRIYLSPPDVGPDEKQLLLEAFDSRWIAPLGPHVDAFEREFAAAVGVPHALALSSGTAALHLALLVQGIGPGDIVITSTLTFAATAYPITYVGATPVFVDVDADTWTMNVERLEEALRACDAAGRPAKAVISVDLYGQACDFDAIDALCAAHGAVLIDDAAEALGATYRDTPVGRHGACAVFSFNGNKIITTSGGGMLVSQDAEFIARARHLSTQARDPAPHYQHSSIGYNYRLSNLLAAVGRGQLTSLADKVAKRRAVNTRYRQALSAAPGITFMPIASYGQPNFWLTCIQVDPVEAGVTREDLRLALERADIEARPVWKPMHMQPVFEHCGAYGGDTAAALFDNGLCLPSGSNLTETDHGRVLDVMLAEIRMKTLNA